MLGGSHFIMSDALQAEQTQNPDFTSDAMTAMKFSQGSTTGSEATKNGLVRGSSMKRR